VEGVGGASEELSAARGHVSQTPLAQARAHLLSLYTDQNTREYPSTMGPYIRDDTMAGRALLGIWNLWKKGVVAQEDLKQALVEADAVLGVRAEYLWYRGRNPDDAYAFKSALFHEWERIGMHHLFLGSDAAKKTAPLITQPEIAAVSLDKQSYKENDNVVRIRFDIALPAGMRDVAIQKSRLYLYNSENGLQIPGGGFNISFITTLEAELSLQHLFLIPGSGDAYSNTVRFKLALWATDDLTKPGLQGEYWSDPVQLNVEKSGMRPGEYSRNPDPETAAKESFILAHYADSDHFVVRDPSAWHWTIASEFHDANAIHAVDLNYGSGSADRGKAVYAPADGVIEIAGGDTWNTVAIKHTAIRNGEEIVWYTKVLHMINARVTHKDGSEEPLVKGMKISRDDQIGEVGDTGSTGQNHLHLEIVRDPTSAYGMTIDLHAILFDIYNMRAFVADAGPDNNQSTYRDGKEIEVKWNNEIGALMTFSRDPNDAQKIIWGGLVVDRSEQAIDHTKGHQGEARIHWIAWDNEKILGGMERVVYDELTDAWYQWDVSLNKFYENSEGKKRQWFPNQTTAVSGKSE
jgi:murein DD-endopeptidase MepM/ murein hydrolase activator NlpD